MRSFARPRRLPRPCPAPKPLGTAVASDATRNPLRRAPRATAVALVALAPLAAALTARTVYPENYPVVPLGTVPCQEPLSLHLIDDRSGSTWQTDPLRRRQRELVQLARWHAGDRCDLEVSALSFDSVTPAAPPGPTSDRSTLDRVATALPVDGPESSSTLTPSVQQATEWAARASGRRHIAVVATDGMVDTEDAIPALRRFPGETVVIALGGPLPPEWEAGADVIDHVVVLDRQVGLGDVAANVAEGIRQLHTSSEDQEVDKP